MSAQNNAKLTRDIYELFNQGQLEKALELAAEDCAIDLVPFGMTFEGREGFMQFMGNFKRAFPDLTVTIVNQVATDDQVVNECTWNGTHTGPLGTPTGEIPPTGKKVAGGRFCEVLRIKNGKMAHLTNYQDPAGWLRQLGLIN
jgi:steroid delta-isomerase-like uncharacterized protein